MAVVCKHALVFFLDKNNNPLHTSPLKYAARGVNGATFETERRAFKAELETCHAITNQVPAKPKNDVFHSLGVFCFTTKAELAGDKQKAWVCRVVGHEKPTTENWRNYFIGYSQLKNYAWEALEPGQKIDVLSAPVLEGVEQVPALPAGDELQTKPPQQQEAIASSTSFSKTAIAPDTASSASDSTTTTEGDDNPDIPF